jgi:HEAT repeat protein
VFRPPPLPRTLSAALADVTEPRAEVRVSAVRDLVRQDDAHRAEVVAALSRALRDDVPAVRSAAALALADLEASEALAALLVTVEDDDPAVRQSAITALGEIGDPRASERLRRALGDDRPEVRFQAIIALPRVDPESTAHVVERGLADADAKIRYVALRVAEERAETDGSALPVALLDRARERLRDDDASVRAAAAILLARAGDRAGVDVLLQIVDGRLRTPEPEDEAAAVELAGELGLGDARPALERRAFGLARIARETFAWQARVALARLGHHRARREILGGLAAWSRDRRTLAVAAVGRARLVEARSLLEEMRGRPDRAEPSAVEEALAALSG